MNVDPQLLALICGHFLGDFVLQTDRLAERKANHQAWMLCHVSLVSTTTWVLLGNLRAWWIAGLLLLFHWLVDCITVWGSNKSQNCSHAGNTVSSESTQIHGGSDETRQAQSDYLFLWFVGAQVFHMLSIVALWFCVGQSGAAEHLANYWTTLWGMSYAKGLILLIGLAACLGGIGKILKHQMAGFAAELGGTVKNGLPKGGTTIGMLERLLAFMFVLVGKPEGVGFVIAAKSVFRIGQLTDRKDKDHAEYILIGTLRSFTYALLAHRAKYWLTQPNRVSVFNRTSGSIFIGFGVLLATSSNK
ncbi:MAG: DUF3307 domain-containing protein [Desulfobacterium sp.]|nr:DUF3307 domain-containing protein [Desulfobacterium sp.]